MADVQQTSIYDYTAPQAEMLRLYELRTTGLVGRMYHQVAMRRYRWILSAVDTVSTLTASSAFVSLAFFKTEAGQRLLTVMILVVAILGIVRSSFRLGEAVERHSRLYTAWAEMFLDLDQLIASVRRAEHITDEIRVEIDLLSRRFSKVEGMDEDRPSRRVLLKLQSNAEASLPVQEQWLPSN
jgi:hypothetical protein